MREQFAPLLEKNQEEWKELYYQVKRQMGKQDADRRVQIIRAELPKLPGIGSLTDIEEYLELFEAHMTCGEYPRAAWSGQLQPLLNDDCRSAVLQLSPESRDVYDEVKTILVETCSNHHIRVGDKFWNFERSLGVTFPQAVRKLTRLAT